MLVHTCNLSIQEPDARGWLEVRGQHGLQSIRQGYIARYHLKKKEEKKVEGKILKIKLS